VLVESKHNVLLHPFKLLVEHHGEIRSAFETLQSRLKDDVEQDRARTEPCGDTSVGSPGNGVTPAANQGDLRLRDEMACLVALMNNGLGRLLSPAWSMNSLVAYNELWLLIRPGDIIVEPYEEIRTACLVQAVTGVRRLVHKGSSEPFAYRSSATDVATSVTTRGSANFAILHIYSFRLDFDGPA
jgi:hypothetical protein